MKASFRILSLATMMVALGCGGTPLESDPADLETSEINRASDQAAGQSCEIACGHVVSCLGGGYGSGAYGYGGYSEGYGAGYGGYGSGEWTCGYGGYGAYGSGEWSCGYGAGGYGSEEWSCGYGVGYGAYGSEEWSCGYGAGYGGYGAYGSGEWSCGYGAGYGGYGSGSGYGYGGTGGGALQAQCVAGCQALPAGLRSRLISCVMSARTCQLRLACE